MGSPPGPVAGGAPHGCRCPCANELCSSRPLYQSYLVIAPFPGEVDDHSEVVGGVALDRTVRGGAQPRAWLGVGSGLG